ncbi:MAG: hypothetical protein RL535_1388 [Pseudomonadota bacterium]|jgi:hypothetical protein
MKIKLATLEDMQAILELGLAMHKESRFAVYPMSSDKIQQTILDIVSEPKANCILLAEHDSAGLVGMLAGCVTSLFFTDVLIAQDRWFYVAKEHRGSPAALKLLVTFRRWAENRQARELNINMSVDIDQVRFNQFMTHMDFKSCGSNFVLPLALVKREPVAQVMKGA